MGTVNVKIPLKLSEETTNIIEANTQAQIRNLRTTVNEQELSITTVIEEVGQQNAKISQVTQTVDELNSKISDNMDFTTSGESTYANISLESVNESNPITIKVHPIVENISYLYPNTGLFPGLSALLKVRIIRFTRTYIEDGETKTQNIDYELPDNLLYYDSANYDEFYLDLTNETCQITKRCAYNADGTTRLLAEPIVVNYPFPDIYLLDGDYNVSILGYGTGYIFVRALTSNAYTSQFVTKAEHQSDIRQTTEEINLSVDEKLTGYPTTTEMNSAISVKANEITSTVASTYETKDNAQTNYSQLTQTATSLQSQIISNDQDISTINQTVNGVSIEVGKKYNTSDFTNAKITAKINDGTSSVKINADKIGLSANNVIDIISGNTINLSSKNIAISSNNFNVDANGNMRCSNANVSRNNHKF